VSVLFLLCDTDILCCLRHGMLLGSGPASRRPAGGAAQECSRWWVLHLIRIQGQEHAVSSSFPCLQEQGCLDLMGRQLRVPSVSACATACFWVPVLRHTDRPAVPRRSAVDGGCCT
jgi:hypothetical protein